MIQTQSKPAAHELRAARHLRTRSLPRSSIARRSRPKHEARTAPHLKTRFTQAGMSLWTRTGGPEELAFGCAHGPVIDARATVSHGAALLELSALVP